MEVIKSRINESPELRLIGMSHDDILKKHANDYKQYTLLKVTLTELRAIRASLPEFKRNQTTQLTWVEKLDLRIDEISAEERNKEGRSSPVKKPSTPTIKVKIMNNNGYK